MAVQEQTSKRTRNKRANKNDKNNEQIRPCPAVPVLCFRTSRPFVLKNPVAVSVPFVADCEQTRQRVIEGSNGVDTSENVDYLYYVGT